MYQLKGFYQRVQQPRMKLCIYRQFEFMNWGHTDRFETFLWILRFWAHQGLPNYTNWSSRICSHVLTSLFIVCHAGLWLAPQTQEVQYISAIQLLALAWILCVSFSSLLRKIVLYSQLSSAWNQIWHYPWTWYGDSYCTELQAIPLSPDKWVKARIWGCLHHTWDKEIIGHFHGVNLLSVTTKILQLSFSYTD